MKLSLALLITGLALSGVLEAEVCVTESPYGAVGDGITDDTESFKKAIHDAESSGDYLCVPQGTYLLVTTELNIGGTMGLGGRLRIIGEGMEKTTIHLKGIASFPSIQIIQDNATVIFEDLTIRGSTDSDDETGNLINYLGDGPVLPNDGMMVFESCRIHSDLDAIRVSAPGVGIEIFNCHIIGRQGILMSEVVGAGELFIGEHNGYCNVFGTVFETTSPMLGSHAMYINTGNSVWVNNCQFLSSGGMSIKLYHGANIPNYALVENSYFTRWGVSGEEAAIRTNARRQTTISNCEFNFIGGGSRHGGIKIDTAGAIIRDCRFFGEGATVAIGQTEGTGSEATISDCEFVGSFSTAAIFHAWNSQKRWEILNCHFENNYPSISEGYCILQNGAEINLLVENCEFAKGVRPYIWLRGGYVALRENRVRGNQNIVINPSEEIHVLVSQNDFSENTHNFGGLEVITPGLSPDHLIHLYGSGNIFRDDASPKGLDDATLRGRVRMVPSAAKDGLVASEELFVRAAHNIYGVSGTGIISWVKMPNAGHKIFQGPLHLIATESWSMTDIGNIRPIKTGPREVGEVVTLIYNSSTEKWTEILWHEPISECCDP